MTLLHNLPLRQFLLVEPGVGEVFGEGFGEGVVAVEFGIDHEKQLSVLPAFQHGGNGGGGGEIDGAEW